MKIYPRKYYDLVGLKFQSRHRGKYALIISKIDITKGVVEYEWGYQTYTDVNGLTFETKFNATITITEFYHYIETGIFIKI